MFHYITNLHHPISTEEASLYNQSPFSKHLQRKSQYITTFYSSTSNICMHKSYYITNHHTSCMQCLYCKIHCMTNRRPLCKIHWERFIIYKQSPFPFFYQLAHFPRNCSFILVLLKLVISIPRTVAHVNDAVYEPFVLR